MAPRGDSWSVGALGCELRRLLAEAAKKGGTTSYYSPFRAIERVERIARLARYIRMKGADPSKEGLSMDGVGLLRSQLQLIGQQVQIAFEMLRQLEGHVAPAQPAPDLRVVRGPVSGDPIRMVQVMAAQYTAEGRSWDMFADLIPADLMLAANKQYCEFGPGRGHGRRDPAGFRRHIMAGVPTPELAAAPPPNPAPPPAPEGKPKRKAA